MSLRTRWVNVNGRVVDNTRRKTFFLPGHGVIFSYRAGKNRYSGHYTLPRARALGTEIPVQYDAKNPKRIRRMERQRILNFLIPAAIVLVFLLWLKELQRPSALL